MERPFACKKSLGSGASEAFGKSGDQSQQIQHQRETTNASATHLVIFARVRQAFCAYPGEEGLPRRRRQRRTDRSFFPDWSKDDDDQEDTGEELDDGESKNKTVHEIQSFLF